MPTRPMGVLTEKLSISWESRSSMVKSNRVKVGQTGYGFDLQGRGRARELVT